MNARIVCAANKIFLDVGFIILVGPRHWDQVMVDTYSWLDPDVKNNSLGEEQGFIDQFGKFYTREEAWVIAEANGQIIRRVGGDDGKLFSENLY